MSAKFALVRLFHAQEHGDVACGYTFSTSNLLLEVIRISFLKAFFTLRFEYRNRPELNDFGILQKKSIIHMRGLYPRPWDFFSSTKGPK